MVLMSDQFGHVTQSSGVTHQGVPGGPSGGGYQGVRGDIEGGLHLQESVFGSMKPRHTFGTHLLGTFHEEKNRIHVQISHEGKTLKPCPM